MKKTRLAIMLVLVCLVFVGCGAKKPSTKQIRKDIEGSQIISFPIESMEIRSDQGDKEDYRARVRLTGKRDIFEITTDAILRYEKVGKAWELTDYEVPSDSVKATISRCPTEQDILTGFSSLQSVETYIAYDGCFVNEDSSIEPSSDKKCRMNDQSNFDHIKVSNIELGESPGWVDVSFEVSYTESYLGVTATVENRKMNYAYNLTECHWMIFGPEPECVDLDYSGLIGRRIGNDQHDGYIEDISKDGISIILDGERHEYRPDDNRQNISTQYIYMLYWGDFYGWSAMTYRESYDALRLSLIMGEDTIKLRDTRTVFGEILLQIYE